VSARRSIPLGKLAAGAACAVLAAGCGASAGGSSGGLGGSAASGVCDTNAASAVRKSHKVFLAWPDVTYSTVKTRATYLRDMVTFAGMAARARSPLLMDAFTGAPENTTAWPVSCDFSRTPKAFGGNGDLEESYLRSRAEKLRPEMRKLLDKAGARGGSPLLNVFVLSGYATSSHPGTTACIAVFTDAAVFGPDFNINQKLGSQQRAALLNRWAPRLQELRGSKVLIVGVGRGTEMSLDQLEYVRSVLTQLFSKVGAELVVFDTRLPSSARC